MEKPRVGITLGDMNGIGMEVIIKSLDNPKLLDFCTPVIYGSAKVLSYHKNIVRPRDFNYQTSSSASKINPDRINLINCWNEDASINLGTPDEGSGKFAYIALDKATQDLKEGYIDTLVTAPIDKHAMHLAGFPATGHTEYLTQQFGMDQSLMLMVHDELRIGVATNHIPIREAAGQITKELVIGKARLFYNTLVQDFGIEKPLLAILGLNPHAGDQGLIGQEEQEHIIPAIEELKKEGMLIGGPYAADGFFGSSNFGKVDGILAMYHDQGMIPFKTLSFGRGVNFTAGLPVVRTSPDHGTGNTIAGQNIADHHSFQQALFLSFDIWKHRKNLQEYQSNKLKIGTLVEEGEDEDPIPEEFSDN